MSVRATVVIDLPVAATARQIQELLEYELGVYCSLSGDNTLNHALDGRADSLMVTSVKELP